jgi:hypothetical protein
MNNLLYNLSGREITLKTFGGRKAKPAAHSASSLGGNAQGEMIFFWNQHRFDGAAVIQLK